MMQNLEGRYNLIKPGPLKMGGFNTQTIPKIPSSLCYFAGWLINTYSWPYVTENINPKEAMLSLKQRQNL